MKSKLSVSTTSLTSIKGLQNPIVTEIKEITKKLHFKDQELEKAYGMASDDVSIQATREQILYALKAVEYAKQHLTDKTQEFCNKLNDYGICVTYSFASYKRSGKDILEFISPYLLKNAFDIEYIKAYIPEGYIKESNKNDAMELLGKREVRDYLEVKSTELASNRLYRLPLLQQIHLIMIVMKCQLLEKSKLHRILNKLDIIDVVIG